MKRMGRVGDCSRCGAESIQRVERECGERRSGWTKGDTMKRIWFAAMVGVAICIGGCKSVAPGAAAGKARPADEGSKAPEQAVRPAAKGEVLAKIGGTVITDATLEDKINLNPTRRKRYQSAVAKKDLLNRLVELEVVYQEAVREGLDKDKETLDRLEDYRERLVATRLTEKFIDGVKVSDADIQAEYKARGDRYKVPKQVKVSQIVLGWDQRATEKEIAAVKENARDILERVKKGQDFAALAKKYSIDQASAAKGGDIGYANKTQLPPEAYAAAMAFEKEGAVSDLIVGKEDVRILKATEVIPPGKKSLEEIRPLLERMALNKKQREAWQAYLDGLKKKSGAEVYENRVSGTEESPAPVGRQIPMRMQPSGNGQGAAPGRASEEKPVQ